MKKNKLSWKKHDTLWVFTLFGTAVGAGILFLPIEAGLNGIWPCVLLALFTIPMVYYSHKFFAYFVLSANHEKDDITLVARQHFGFKIGALVTLLYFLAIFPILLIYGVGLTNTIQSFIEHQLHFPNANRALLSFVLTAMMMAVMYLGESIMLMITEFMVIPLIVLLFSISIYLIPHWNLSSLYFVPTKPDFIKSFIFTLPVLIFAFNHSPAISSFVVSQRTHYHKNAEKKVAQILGTTSALLFVFVMFFVFSCILALTPEALLQAKNSNVSVMTYLANAYDSPVFGYLASFIAITAITSSFFGHYLGAREGLKGIIIRLAESAQVKVNSNYLNKFIFLFFFISIWIVSYLNPSILGLLEAFVGPVIAILLFIMPVLAINKIPALAQYRNQRISQNFVLIIGLLAVSVMIFSLVKFIV